MLVSLVSGLECFSLVAQCVSLSSYCSQSSRPHKVLTLSLAIWHCLTKDTNISNWIQPLWVMRANSQERQHDFLWILYTSRPETAHSRSTWWHWFAALFNFNAPNYLLEDVVSGVWVLKDHSGGFACLSPIHPARTRYHNCQPFPKTYDWSIKYWNCLSGLQLGSDHQLLCFMLWKNGFQ